MKLVVFGSTGGTGLQIVHQALERGHDVVAFVRDPSSLTASSPRLRVVKGDVLHADDVRQAVLRADAAISALGVKLGQAPRTVRSDGTRNIVSALTEQGVNRFVSVSTVGVSDSYTRLSLIARLLIPRIIGPERLLEAERQEQIVRSTNLEWTVLRPPRLVDDPGTGRYRIGTDLKTGLNSRITRSDLAKALLDELETRQFVRSCPMVVN